MSVSKTFLVACAIAAQITHAIDIAAHDADSCACEEDNLA